MPDNKHLLTFHSDAVDDETVHILELSGLEEISRYYVFTLELVSKKADIDFVEMLKKPARIEIKHGVKLAGGDKRGQQTLKIHGLIRNFEQVEQRLDWVRYKAELVPPLWKLSMNFQSRCFIDKTVPDIVKEIFKDAGMSEGTDFEMKNLSGYPTREFVMQYEETDLDFIDRWLEHEGIFYYWEHSDQGSKMILANATAAYNPMQGTPTIAYNPQTDTNNRVEAGESEKASDDWFREEIIPVFHCTQKVIPKKVILKEYNWRKPTDELKVEHEVSQDGIGTVYEYNNHYKDTGEGDKLAEVRAQEHMCREIIFSGESDCRSFRAGATYTLEKHYRNDYNKEHLLTAVQHTASQTVELASNQTIDAKYRNRFTSIPGDRVFRPVRQTKWPQISGFMNAKVDASGNGQYAEIDDMGRYKIKLPLDLSDRKDGKASRYIRMAQPYSGADMGMHFPLHKGTEVLLTFMDGDPDRPIISSSVPNPDTASPVTGSNQSQCKIQTGGGNQITIEDSDGNQRITMKSPGSDTQFSMGQKGNPDSSGFWMRTAADLKSFIQGNETLSTMGNVYSLIHGNGDFKIDGSKTELILGVGDKTIVGASKEQVLGGKISSISPWKQEFVGGFVTSEIAGLKAEMIGGAASSSIRGAKRDSIVGAKMEYIKGAVMSIKDVKEYTYTPNNDRKYPASVKEATAAMKAAYGHYKAECKSNAMLSAAIKLEEKANRLELAGDALIKCKSPQMQWQGTAMKWDAADAQLKADALYLKAASTKVKDKLTVKNGTLKVK